MLKTIAVSERIIFISSSHCVMFVLLDGQKSEQANSVFKISRRPSLATATLQFATCIFWHTLIKVYKYSAKRLIFERLLRKSLADCDYSKFTAGYSSALTQSWLTCCCQVASRREKGCWVGEFSPNYSKGWNACHSQRILSVMQHLQKNILKTLAN